MAVAADCGRAHTCPAAVDQLDSELRRTPCRVCTTPHGSSRRRRRRSARPGTAATPRCARSHSPRCSASRSGGAGGRRSADARPPKAWPGNGRSPGGASSRSPCEGSRARRRQPMRSTQPRRRMGTTAERGERSRGEPCRAACAQSMTIWTLRQTGRGQDARNLRWSVSTAPGGGGASRPYGVRQIARGSVAEAMA